MIQVVNTIGTQEAVARALASRANVEKEFKLLLDTAIVYEEEQKERILFFDQQTANVKIRFDTQRAVVLLIAQCEEEKETKEKTMWNYARKVIESSSMLSPDVVRSLIRSLFT